MTTFLGAGASLMIRVLALTFAACLVLVLVSMAAVAQDAVVVTPTGPAPVSDDSLWATVLLIRDSFIAMILGAIGIVISWASAYAPSWLRAIIDKLTTSEAIEWDDHVRIALTNAFDIAAAKVGVTPENLETIGQKADFMGWAVGALKKYNKEIVTFADKDQNGIIDLVEVELAKRGANPKLFEVAPVPFPVPPVPQEEMGFMQAAQPARRAVKPKTAADLASTFAPSPRRAKGTVQ